jgi:predicted RecA/RadA family phage recombinase
MRNFVQPANVIGVVMTADVLSGQVVQVGKIVGVATTDGKTGTVVELLIEGAVELPKNGTAITVGSAADFDLATQKVTAGGAVLLGYVYVAAATSATTCWVKLIPSAASAVP